MGVVQVGLILDGNFLWWKFSEWELSGGNHPGGSFHVTDITLQESAVTFYFNVFKIKNFSEERIESNRMYVSRKSESNVFRFFIWRVLTHYSFTFNSQFLNELKHKVRLSKTLCGIFSF